MYRGIFVLFINIIIFNYFFIFFFYILLFFFQKSSNPCFFTTVTFVKGEVSELTRIKLAVYDVKERVTRTVSIFRNYIFFQVIRCISNFQQCTIKVLIIFYWASQIVMCVSLVIQKQTIK